MSKSIVKKVVLNFNILLDIAVYTLVVFVDLPLHSSNYDVHLVVLPLSPSQQLLHLPDVHVLLLFGGKVLSKIK